MMRIKMLLTIPFDNEIQFFDACKGASEKLLELGEHALSTGDCDQFIGTSHDVIAANDDAEVIGQIKVMADG